MSISVTPKYRTVHTLSLEEAQNFYLKFKNEIWGNVDKEVYEFANLIMEFKALEAKSSLITLELIEDVYSPITEFNVYRFSIKDKFDRTVDRRNPYNISILDNIGLYRVYLTQKNKFNELKFSKELVSKFKELEFSLMRKFSNATLEMVEFIEFYDIYEKIKIREFIDKLFWKTSTPPETYFVLMEIMSQLSHTKWSSKNEKIFKDSIIINEDALMLRKTTLYKPTFKLQRSIVESGDLDESLISDIEEFFKLKIVLGKSCGLF